MSVGNSERQDKRNSCQTSVHGKRQQHKASHQDAAGLTEREQNVLHRAMQPCNGTDRVKCRDESEGVDQSRALTTESFSSRLLRVARLHLRLDSGQNQKTTHRNVKTAMSYEGRLQNGRGRRTSAAFRPAAHSANTGAVVPFSLAATLMMVLAGSAHTARYGFQNKSARGHSDRNGSCGTSINRETCASPKPHGCKRMDAAQR